MHDKRVYDLKIAIERLKNYCALQDRCQWNVTQKMKEWGLLEMTQNHILEILIQEKYVDEERFAQSFCRGKFIIKKWGKVKITKELKKKKISDICIKKGLEEIDLTEYDLLLENLLIKKNDTLRDKNHFTRKSKLARFLIQRGFEGNLVWDKIRELRIK
ncbi:RecX family transcriptional regulator [Flavobacteriales bacterium]|nr:RecX family transcriptional regulator [Flavobacteriales bacterium]